MNKTDFTDRLENESKNIKLPEKLSKENIVKQLENKPQMTVVKPQNGYDKQKKRRIASSIVSVAAAVAIIFGIVNIPKPAVINKSDYGVNTESEYADIEKNITEYYMQNCYVEKHWYDNVANSFSLGRKDTAINEYAAESAADGVVNYGYVTTLTANEAYGKTNIQVQGVDEADIIKNDGSYLYIISENMLYIVDKALNKMSEVKITEDNLWNEKNELFINGDKLIVISNISEEFDSVRYYGKNSPYCCECCYIDLRNKTQIKVFDITDRSNPDLEYEYSVDGSYISSRMFNGKILVVSDYTVPYNSIEGNSEEELCTALACVSVPREYENEDESRVDVNNISIIDGVSPMNYIVNTMFSIDNAKETTETTALLGDASDVYCTGDYLFIANSDYGYWYRDEQNNITIDGKNYNSATDVYMYSVSGNKAEYICKQKIPGVSIGQFSMDYYNGYFRIGVNIDMYNENENGNVAVNRIYVLDNKLNLVGKSDDFGIGENLRSVRFTGNVAYAVTFVQTDPLFVIDLSNPRKPVISGEVKLPGYSEYMHPIQNNMIIGVGYGGTEDGLDGSAKISLFDAEDMKNPKELYSYTVKNSYFITDSRAFAILSNGLYGLIYSCYENSYNKIMFVVFGVDGDKLNVKYTGSLGQCYEDNEYFYEGNSRLTYIGNVLYGIKGSSVYSFDINTGKEIKNVKM